MAALRGGHPGRHVRIEQAFWMAGSSPAMELNKSSSLVIPAQAGIQASFNTTTTAKV